jgi:hypothetical protein
MMAAVLAAAIIVLVPSAARADGDPASDVLLERSVFLPYETPSPAVAARLSQAVGGAYARGDRVKVAVIATREDLGSVPSLFDRPADYAQFLGTELGLWYVGPLLVVMPDGIGVYDGGRSTDGEQKVLRSLQVAASSSDDLVQSATRAVTQLEAAGALRSRDIRAPFVTTYPATAERGRDAALHFDLFDDSGTASATVRVFGGGKELATMAVRPVVSVGTRHATARWLVPRRISGRQLRFCVTATDPAGNRSAPSCAIFLRVSG